MHRDKINFQLLDSPVWVEDSFLQTHFFVYGTLRLGQGNWDRLLKRTCEYVDTIKYKGINYNGGLSATYTGNPENECVLDLFKVKDEILADRKRHELITENVDSIEGIVWNRPQDWAYQSYAIPLKEYGHNVIAKFYNSPGRNRNESHVDHLGKNYVQRNLEYYLELKEIYSNQPIQNFLSFYGFEEKINEIIIS